MEYIKVANVPDVLLFRHGSSAKATLHLTTHHMILTIDKGVNENPNLPNREVWICYPMLQNVTLHVSLANIPYNESINAMISAPKNQITDVKEDLTLASNEDMTGIIEGHSTKALFYPNLNQIDVSNSPAVMRIRCRDFTMMGLCFQDHRIARDVYDSIMKLTCVPNIDRLYGFMFTPSKQELMFNGWKIYDKKREWERMGLNFFKDSSWRITNLNTDYKLCPSYPSYIVVPSAISDTVIIHAAKFRSKARLPALSYFHGFNSCTITRCAQPLVGLKQNRSAQDEKLVYSIFISSQPTQEGVRGSTQDNLIVDARPTANAVAQTALGAGSENIDNYKGSRKIYLGIDNIHVMRDSLGRVIEALKDTDITSNPVNRELLVKSNWLKHINIVLEGAIQTSDTIHFNFSHVLIHCSDGWDRTSQISSLAQVFLDPYYRTMEGFAVLVEKEWLSFGHRFFERCGHLSSEKQFNFNRYEGGSGSINTVSSQASQVFSSVSSKLVKQSHVKYTSPVFHQFLDCMYQCVRQFPERFEYNERFLRRLLYHTYSCQYGTFLFNSEKERKEYNIENKSASVWGYFLARRSMFTHSKYDKAKELNYNEKDRYLVPNTADTKWWFECFGRSDEEMNGSLKIPDLLEKKTKPAEEDIERKHHSRPRSSRDHFEPTSNQVPTFVNPVSTLHLTSSPDVSTFSPIGSVSSSISSLPILLPLEGKDMKLRLDDEKSPNLSGAQNGEVTSKLPSEPKLSEPESLINSLSLSSSEFPSTGFSRTAYPKSFINNQNIESHGKPLISVSNQDSQTVEERVRANLKSNSPIIESIK
ncbi:phosphatases II [Nadsonia fulvescens var. elongata DSM 6958]|uniref:Phosphatases II n=1 Tax=Nadsonia fulvescens var. elongata DSM 6958 TaxID=857566 RepID=A0A1E3PKZ6_9ASCO|nr:phosphatases II [Nadsonia fulvescens var. elongata DSM 6958]